MSCCIEVSRNPAYLLHDTMDYNDTKDSFLSKFLEPDLSEDLLKSIENPMLASSSSQGSMSAYSTTQNPYTYTDNSSAASQAQASPFSSPELPYIPNSDLECPTSTYNPPGFMIKEEPWEHPVATTMSPNFTDGQANGATTTFNQTAYHLKEEQPWEQPVYTMSQTSTDSKSSFIQSAVAPLTPLQLHFNDSPYGSPNKSDNGSVHSPSDCLVSPFTSPSALFIQDSLHSSPPNSVYKTVSPEFSVAHTLNGGSPSVHINSYLQLEKRGKRGRPRGSKNRSTLAKSIDPSLFPADALYPGKKRGRGTRVRGQNPGIRARVNYRSITDYPKIMEEAVHVDHANKRGSSTRGRGAMRMCKFCANCMRTDDCAECVFCKDKSKFGGSNKLKQKCLKKQCVYKGKFIEHDNPADATSRYIVQKKLGPYPPPLSHPPINKSREVPHIPTSPDLANKTPPKQVSPYHNATSPGGFPNTFLKFPFTEEAPYAGMEPSTFDQEMSYLNSNSDQISNLITAHKTSSLNFTPPTDSYQPEFLQDIPVKVWIQSDGSHGISYD